MSALVLQLTEVASGVVQQVSAAHKAMPDAGLAPILALSMSALQSALQRLEKVVVNGHAVPSILAQRALEVPDSIKLKIPAKVKAPRAVRAARKVKIPELSVWDPEPISSTIEISRCRALLLEIIRRAAHDWVLYRSHERLELKERANHAFIWLFEEGPGHPWWNLRKTEKRTITAFLNICEELDLDPGVVRRRVREMDVKTITGAGRPAERRRRQDNEDMHCEEHGVVVDFDTSGAEDSPHRSSYENHFAVNTPSYL